MQQKLMFGLMLGGSVLLMGEEAVNLSVFRMPSPVIDAASARFPGVRVRRWLKETEKGQTTYEASITDATGTRSAVFLVDGSFVATEQSIAVSALPDTVRGVIASRYPSAKIRKAEKICHDGAADYEVALARAARKEVTLNSQGEILTEQ